MKVSAIPTQIQNQKAVENKNTKVENAGFNFSDALAEIGKNLANFVPKINANAKVYETGFKKIKSVAEELEEELPTLEDEAEEILGRIGKLMEQYGD